MTLDPRSDRTIATLHPSVQPVMRSFVIAAKAIAAKQNLDVRAISGLRSYAEQDALYAKGRTAPGARVTSARGGFSNHNFGLAIARTLQWSVRGHFDGDLFAVEGLYDSWFEKCLCETFK